MLLPTHTHADTLSQTETCTPKRDTERDERVVKETRCESIGLLNILTRDACFYG